MAWPQERDGDKGSRDLRELCQCADTVDRLTVTEDKPVVAVRVHRVLGGLARLVIVLSRQIVVRRPICVLLVDVALAGGCGGSRLSVKRKSNQDIEGVHAAQSETDADDGDQDDARRSHEHEGCKAELGCGGGKEACTK